ncbi:C45 family autoproteolytic acyltransferase/hydolase [Amycolatopsis anabasis]|uniref:C45 family autoproteolytic acyltransferase/hydolase n=1 Tax=Amycolatopsis anabasis TaxID=1840409 RepID=UPI00131D832C|nr:C45 family peptidase [Amycolatopsis anabasis]
MTAGGIPFIRATGDPFAIGHRHGAARAAELRAFLDDDLCRLNRILWAPVEAAELRPTIEAYRRAIADAAPELAAELDGLASGAGISREEATLLQIRREVLGYRTVPARGDCTTYARTADRGTPVLAQTVDLSGDLDDQIAVLEIARAGTSRRVLVLSFAGLLGYLGVNSDGLAIGLNLVLGGRWRPGLPPYLAIRRLLHRAGSVDEAVAELRTLPLASSRNLVLCDPAKAASVEVLQDEIRVLEGTELVHANHYLHPDLAPGDQLNRFARRSSVRRLATCTEALAGLSPTASAADHFAALSTFPIHVPDNGDIRRERTVATAVMFPALGELHVRPGDSTDSTVFSLARTRRAGCRGS